MHLRRPYGGGVPKSMRLAASMLLVLGTVCGACAPSAPTVAPPRLPAGAAGKVLSRAIAAAGGWERWMALRDVAYVNTLDLLDPDGNVMSESIGWYSALLHNGMQARIESIGLPTEVSLAARGADTWGLRNDTPILEAPRLELARFNLVSNLFWLSLPFALAEMPATVTDQGTVTGEGGVQWQRLKVVFDAGNPAVPGEWFVLYINDKTGLIDRVHARLTASFLRQELWVGKWLDYREWDGLKKERRRRFFPADDNGEIIGALVADQLVEHVHFNNGYGPERFRRPAKAAGAAQAARIADCDASSCFRARANGSPRPPGEGQRDVSSTACGGATLW